MLDKKESVYLIQHELIKQPPFFTNTLPPCGQAINLQEINAALPHAQRQRAKPAEGIALLEYHQ
ncbi:MAG: hypothetical protein WBN40_02995 [Pseudomonadales bacterium]